MPAAPSTIKASSGWKVKALESLLQSGNGKLPINVKIIFEGEEEVGGESIAEFVKKQKPDDDGLLAKSGQPLSSSHKRPWPAPRG